MASMKDQVQDCLNSSGLTDIVKMMVVMAFWLLGGITAADCATFALQLGYTFDTTAHTVSKDADTYTIFQMLQMACDDVYPAKQELGKFVMVVVLTCAKDAQYITADNFTALEAKL